MWHEEILKSLGFLERLAETFFSRAQTPWGSAHTSSIFSFFTWLSSSKYPLFKKMADFFSHHYSPFYPSTLWILTQKWWHQKWNMEIFRQSPNLLLSFFFFRIFHIIIFQSGAKCLRKSFTYFPCWKISLYNFFFKEKSNFFSTRSLAHCLTRTPTTKLAFEKCTALYFSFLYKMCLQATQVLVIPGEKYVLHSKMHVTTRLPYN